MISFSTQEAHYHTTHGNFEWKKLLCKVEFTLLKSEFFPAKFSFSKIQEKNLAGKNTLQRSEVHFE
jgi:hypothetical protein